MPMQLLKVKPILESLELAAAPAFLTDTICIRIKFE